ncbi:MULTISPECIES: LysR family transcriptional regulator [Vibrio]|uniref:LysR family transcriptional regulator n=1 Tax=Vibrio diazotrophicus TaxID=685 RepID=A0A2J8I512_VIBDI|nr:MULTISPECIES: LysR family transcriptional regulator [Vibrio]MCF7361839.1 LysR family transcriptional regulator [Vibrio sp. A1-b2]PNH83215.1 LysR family transcriptional regulator [Vibrio diazotrophicus]PNH94115.1 LysR family transcriptional regulator [Vibrio diazotrophicus]PNI05617.1 LysR family transcriptional regulator [Vibrio diazotrophicus]
MNWTLDQLLAFVTAAELGSFSAAARQLHKAQSRISSAVANLELDLGFELFDRSSKYPVLTPLGKEMLPEARAVLNQCLRLNSRALAAANSDPISLRIAIDEALPLETIHSIFSQVGDLFPSTHLVITNGSQDDIAMAIANQKADIGFMISNNMLPPKLTLQSLGHFKKILIVGNQHPLAQKEVLSLAQLQQYRQLVLCNRSGESRENALSPNHWVIDSYYLICELVTQNQGWAIVPEHIASAQWFTEQLKAVKTDFLSDILVEIGIVKRLDSPSSEITEWITEQMRHLINSHSV